MSLKIVQINLSRRIHMRKRNLVDVFYIALFHCFYNCKMLAVSILKPSFMSQRKFGKLSHTVLKSCEDRRDLSVFGKVDNFSMKLEIILTKFCD